MALSVSSASQAASLPQSATAARSSFLQQCVKDLAPENISIMNRQSTLWTVAAAATFVAFTAISVCAFVYAGLFLPAYMPVVGLTTLVLAIPTANYAKTFLEYSVQSKKEADACREIRNNYADLGKATPHAIQHELMTRGIKWWEIPGMSFAHPENVSTLTPLLAKARQLDSVVRRHMTSMTECSNQALQLYKRPADGSAPRSETMEGRREIYDLRNAALFSQDRALETKIQAAFVNAVLRKSDFRGTLGDIATLSNIHYNERLPGIALGQESTVNDFLTFKNRTLAPISHDDVKRLSVAELGQRIATAMG
jgi:hypothetical protein